MEEGSYKECTTYIANHMQIAVLCLLLHGGKVSTTC